MLNLSIVYIFPNFQNCARRGKDLKDNKDNSGHLGRKYARIFVLGHDLFLVAHTFPRASLSENCSLLGTDHVRGQISKHILAPNGDYCLCIFIATRTGNEFNKTMKTGNGFNKVIMYIIPSKQEREILFEATRACVWLKLDVCSMRVRFATQRRDTSGLINRQVKYFAKANSAFTIFLHRRHGRFIV